MKKLLIVLGLIMTTIACSPQTNEMYDFIIPPELHGCKVFKMYNGAATTIRVVRCPKLDCTSSTYKSGKVTSTTAYCE